MSVDYRNLADVVAQLESAGLQLDTVKKTYGGTLVGSVYVESTKSVRCDVSSETKKQTGAYRLHELRLKDGIWLAGAYWLDHGSASFKLDLNKECAKCGAVMPLKSSACQCGSTKLNAREIPPEEVEAHKKRMAENKRQAEAADAAKAEQAAKWADAVWLASREIFSPDEHEYLARKQLKTAHGTRVFESNEGVILDGADNDDYKYLAQFWGALVVPMLDERGKRRGLQFILSRTQHKDLIARRERDKEYWPRGIGNNALRYVIGGALREVGKVAEGFATAATLHEATGLPVAVAFDAGSLPKVGESLWKAAKKRVNLLYCADDDWLQRCAECKQPTPVAEPNCTHCGKPHGKRNAGIDKAKEAAAATGGAWVAPVFAAARPTNRKGPTDFNDLRVAEGIQAVTGQIEAKLAACEWAINNAYPQGGGGLKPPPGNAGSSSGGAGEIRPDAVAVLTVDEAVERFMFVDESDGGVLVDTLTRQLCKRSKLQNMLAARARIDDVKDHPLWRRRALYLDQIGFDPTGRDDKISFNLWNGWPTEPVPGKCDLLLELLQYQCGEQYEWVLKWLAYPVQHPGAKMQTAIVMHGPQGTGKGRFFEWGYMPIFGRYGVYLDQDALEDKHGSDWQSCKLFVLADEVMARAEMYHQKNKLKNLVTSRRIRINPKGLIAYEETNHLNIVFLSNEKQPLVLENDDRRYCVIWTPPPVGKAFYDELSGEIENGGVAALHHYLKHEVDLGDFKPWTMPPMTEAKRDLINMSRDSVDRFLIDWQAGDTDLPFCPCASADLYRAYLWWCRANGERMPRPENQFSGHIIKMNGWQKAHKDVAVEDEHGHRQIKRMRMILPSVESLNEAALRPHARDYRQKDGQTITEWLTPCFFEFKNALKVEP